jgi:isoamylase
LLFHRILHAYWEPLDFELPALESGTWKRWIDTSLNTPQDIVSWQEAPAIPANDYRVGARAVVLLFSDGRR